MMTPQTIIGLLLVALNAAVVSVLGDQSISLPPYAHAALIATGSATGALLLYLRPPLHMHLNDKEPQQ